MLFLGGALLSSEAPMDTIEFPLELPFPDDANAVPHPMTLAAAPLSTDTPAGWCPFARRQSTPNFWRGSVDRAAVVDHITVALWASVVSWFKNPASQRSAHFQVRRDGSIDQFVSCDDSAWANGASWNGHTWIDPQGHAITPTWALMTPPTNPNRRTISTEHEGYPNEPWTAAQREADTKLNRWLASVYPSLAPFVVGRTLIGHYHISPIAKPNCPGPLVDLAERARAANPPPPPPDPLHAAQIDGPVGQIFRCSAAARNAYVARGGFQVLGYALADERATTDRDGHPCAILVCERAIIKNAVGGPHFALLAEAEQEGWIL